MENNYDKKPYGLRNSGYENRERRPRTGAYNSSRDGRDGGYNRGGYNKQNIQISFTKCSNLQKFTNEATKKNRRSHTLRQF